MTSKGSLAYEWNGTPPTPLESVAITLQMWKLNPPGSTETYATVDVANSTEIKLKTSLIKGIIPLDECPSELLYAITPVDQRSTLPIPSNTTTEDTTPNTNNSVWQMRVLVRSWDDAYSRVDVSLALDTLLTLPTNPFTLFGGNLSLTFHSPPSSSNTVNGSNKTPSPTRKPPPPRSQQRNNTSTTNNSSKTSSATSATVSSSPSPEKPASLSRSTVETTAPATDDNEADDDDDEEDDRWDRSPVSSSSTSSRSPSSIHANHDDDGDVHGDTNNSHDYEDNNDDGNNTPKKPSSSSSSSVVRKILPESNEKNSNDEDDENTVSTNVSTPPETYHHQQRIRSLKEEIKTFETKLATLKASAAELDKRGAGILDMEARANREIKARKAADTRRTEAENEVEKLKNELKVLESSRMVADRTATENAEVAIAWKERSEGWESAYEALKKDHDTLTEKYQQLETTMTVSGTAVDKENSSSSPMPSSPMQRPRSPMTTTNPLTPISIPRNANTPPSSSGMASGRNSPVPMPPAYGSAYTGVSAATNDLATLNATTVAINELQERHNIRIKELENQITVVKSECENLRHQTTKENHRVRSYRQALSAARTCLATYASTIERGCIDVENQIGSLMNYTFPRDDVRSAISHGSTNTTTSLTNGDDNDTDLVNEPMLHSTGHAALAKHGQTAINIALKALEESRKTGYDNGVKASESKLSELSKKHDTLLEERSKLVRDWEQYASHWETRGREAERLLTEFEKSYDVQQQQLTSITKERDDLKYDNENLRNDLQQLRTLSETAINESVSLRDYLTALGHGAAVSSLSRGLTKLSNAILSSSASLNGTNNGSSSTTGNDTPPNNSNNNGNNSVNRNNSNPVSSSGSNRTLLSTTSSGSSSSTNNSNNTVPNVVNGSNPNTVLGNTARPIPHIPPTVPLSIPPITMTNNANNSNNTLISTNNPSITPSLNYYSNNGGILNTGTMLNNNNSITATTPPTGRTVSNLVMGSNQNNSNNNNTHTSNLNMNMGRSVSNIVVGSTGTYGYLGSSNSNDILNNPLTNYYQGMMSGNSSVSSVTVNSNNKSIPNYGNTNYLNSSPNSSNSSSASLSSLSSSIGGGGGVNNLLNTNNSSTNISPLLAPLPLSTNSNISVAASIRRQTSTSKKTGTGGW